MKRIIFTVLVSSIAFGQQRTPPLAVPVTIGVVNQSSTPNATVQAWVAAVQRQVDNEFRQAWHLNASIVFGPGDWQCVIQNPIGSLKGTHDAAAGVPKCMATDSQSLSHEILEMIENPYLDAIAVQQVNGVTANLFLREVCDPVAGYGYYINGYLVSDFTMPAFWGHGYGQMDYLTKATYPLQPTSEGYLLIRLALATSYQGWTAWAYVWGSGSPMW